MPLTIKNSPTSSPKTVAASSIVFLTSVMSISFSRNLEKIGRSLQA